MSAYIGLKKENAVDVPTPEIGRERLFIDVADSKLSKKLDNGSVVKIEQSGSAVTSVFGRSGAVVAIPTDYPVATVVDRGFMSPSDKAKLDGIEANANESVRSNLPPLAIGVTAPGVGTELSRADHVHAHGDQLGGSLHANATVSVAGFMSAPDKTKLDGIDSGANNTILGSTNPLDIGVASAGVSTEASRKDHVHAHGNQGGGNQHLDATILASGFMSALDKVKLNGVDVNANEGVTSLTGEVVGTGPGAASVTLSNAAVIGKLLTGLSALFGKVSATDSILSAISLLTHSQGLHPVEVNSLFDVPQDWNLIRGKTKLGLAGKINLNIGSKLKVI